MRHASLRRTFFLLPLLLPVSLARGEMVAQPPPPSPYPEFAPYVTSPMAQQEVRRDRAPASQAPGMASLYDLTHATHPDFAKDRAALYEFAATQADAGVMELTTACRSMVIAGNSMAYLGFNIPPAVRQAGQEVIQAGRDHCRDASLFQTKSRLNVGGNLVVRLEDLKRTPGMSFSQTIPSPVTPAQPSPTNGSIPANGPPPPVTPAPGPAFTPPNFGSPAPRTNYVYTATNSQVDPVARNAIGSLLPPSFLSYLRENGVNEEQFQADFAAGRLQNASDFLRAAGLNDFSDADIASATQMAQKQFPALSREKEKESEKVARVGRGGPNDDGFDPRDAWTPRVKRRKDPRGLKEQDPGGPLPRSLQGERPGVTAPLSPELLAALATKQTPGGSAPDWYNLLALGVFQHRYPQSIFHIAHREFQNFAPMQRMLGRGTPLLSTF